MKTFIDNLVRGIFRRRTLMWGMGLIGVPLVFILTGPDAGIVSDLPFGAGIMEYAVYATKIFLVVLVLHIIRKGFHDYKESDLRVLLSHAVESSVGAGLAIVGLSIMTLAYAVVVLAVVGGG